MQWFLTVLIILNESSLKVKEIIFEVKLGQLFHLLKAFLRNNLFSPENYGLLGLQLEEDQYWRGGVGIQLAVINVKVLHGRIYSLNDFSSNGLI